MPKMLQKGIAHILIIVLVLLGIVIVISYSVFATRRVQVDSNEDIVEILNKRCPSEEELIAAEAYIGEFGPEDLKDDVEAKKKEPRCEISQQVIDKCIIPYAKPGPGDPFGEEICTPCYFVMNANTRERIGNVCRDEIWKSDECFNWDVISYEADGLISCYKTWGITEESELEDLPAVSEDQDVELELEPLTP